MVDWINPKFWALKMLFFSELIQHSAKNHFQSPIVNQEHKKMKLFQSELFNFSDYNISLWNYQKSITNVPDGRIQFVSGQYIDFQ